MSYFSVCHFSADQGIGKRAGVSAPGEENRKFVLTPAGEHFYKKSLILMADYEQICSEAAKIARGDEVILKFGYLRGYNSREVHLALEEFAAKYPRVSFQVLYGNHEELFNLLRNGGADLVLND